MAQKLGLGDETRVGDDWPIDEGDAVLAMPFEGDPSSSLVLAVNDDVAERLLANGALLNSTFAEATQAINDATGLSLAPTAVERSEVMQPSFIAEIVDDGSLTAVAGMTLPLDEAAGAPEPPPAAEPFEPAPIETAVGNGAGGHGGAGGAGVGAMSSSLHVLHDVEMVVTAELGRTTMPVRDLLGLAPGMVVEIDRAAGAPIDLLVNGRKIAAGEVVVIDEEFGIRITEIAPSGEHVR
ncbi:MAG: flagellar motor switch protein FliN [Acidimicrobiaceae bacterium]|nr:flagellar motor switch protein FliN [Acidimicrobiaceae bacterium]